MNKHRRLGRLVVVEEFLIVELLFPLSLSPLSVRIGVGAGGRERRKAKH